MPQARNSLQSAESRRSQVSGLLLSCLVLGSDNLTIGGGVVHLLWIAALAGLLATGKFALKGEAIAVSYDWFGMRHSGTHVR
jgi:hypothetical protein